MTSEADLKVFMMTTQLIENDLDNVETEYSLDLGRHERSSLEPDEEYYPQIEHAIRAEASSMAPHYEVFYSLERTVRRLISDSIQATDGPDWWNGKRVPDKIKQDCEKRRQTELDTGVTPRSDDRLDFATFGELSEVITFNWDVFGSLFRSAKAVQRVMAGLNTLRGPIAHCSPLASDEVSRLRLAVSDWFRLME